jgi:hypothetical protein
MPRQESNLDLPLRRPRREHARGPENAVKVRHLVAHRIVSEWCGLRAMPVSLGSERSLLPKRPDGCPRQRPGHHRQRRHNTHRGDPARRSRSRLSRIEARGAARNSLKPRDRLQNPRACATCLKDRAGARPNLHSDFKHPNHRDSRWTDTQGAGRPRPRAWADPRTAIQTDDDQPLLEPGTRLQAAGLL